MHVLLRTCGPAANLDSGGTLPRKDPSAGVISLLIQALLYKALNLPPLFSSPNLRSPWRRQGVVLGERPQPSQPHLVVLGGKLITAVWTNVERKALWVC